MSISTLSLAGQVALVSGASRGIGKSIALGLAEAGADVAICSRTVSDGKLEATAKEIEGLGRRSLAVQADISRKVDIDNLVQQTLKKFGVIDILVNNAGISFKNEIVQATEEEWDKIMGVDLKGFFFCSQAVARGMIQRKKGNIISIASYSAFKAVAGWGIYCIAKSGVVMLTKVLARELGAHGIRANAIAPGVVKTELNRSVWTNPELLQARLSAISLGRLAETTDIAKVALFLASEASGYVSGHTLLVDGGQLA